MRFLVSLAVVAALACAAFAAPPKAPPVTINDRVESLEKEIVDLKAEVATLKAKCGGVSAAPVASVPEFTRICTIDPLTGQQTCRLVRTPRGVQTGCGCEGQCSCKPGQTCGSPDCPVAQITYPPFGAAACASGNCGTSTASGCASGNCGSAGAEGGSGYTAVPFHPVRNIIHGQGPVRRLFGRVRGGCCGG